MYRPHAWESTEQGPHAAQLGPSTHHPCPLVISLMQLQLTAARKTVNNEGKGREVDCIDIQFPFSWAIPISGIAALYGKCICNFLRNCQPVFPGDYDLTFSPAACESSSCSTSSSTLGIVRLLNFRLSHWHAMSSPFASNLYFLMTVDFFPVHTGHLCIFSCEVFCLVEKFVLIPYYQVVRVH